LVLADKAQNLSTNAKQKGAMCEEGLRHAGSSCRNGRHASALTSTLTITDTRTCTLSTACAVGT